MKTVGLFGFYDYGNFGDNMMAIGIARTIEKCGARAIICSRDDKFNCYGIERREDLLALRECDIVILGGGGALLEHSSVDPSARTNRYSATLLEITRIIEKYEIPAYAVSIGGESRHSIRPLRAGTVSLLTSPMFQSATVRLRDDIDCLEQLGVKAEYFPDIVLSLKEMFDGAITPSMARSERIGVQCPAGPLAKSLAILAAARLIPEIVFVHTFPPNLKGVQEDYGKLPHSDHFFATDVMETLELIQSLKCAVGYRLHFGMAAAALGVPFCITNPKHKTRRFFDDGNIEMSAMPSGLSATARIPGFLRRMVRSEMSPTYKIAREASRGHLEFIKEIVGEEGGRVANCTQSSVSS